MIVQVPEADAKAWPTLGPYVYDFMVNNLVHGPGDRVGQPLELDEEKRGFIYRLYEVYPRNHERAGRRRFKEAGLSLRKGLAKTEFAALISACELSPAGPVRTVGWDRKGYPIGGAVTDPYIPMVAYTEQQTEELAYGALRVILTESRIKADFDIGLDRIMRRDGHGKAEALASSPNAADGARTTFQLFDETHRMNLPRLKKAHSTMLANMPKRRAADAWSLETTTAFAPGEGSVAEVTMEKAEAILAGKRKDPAFFFFHRQASDKHDLKTSKGARAAVEEATGPAALSWAGDLDEILRQLKNPPNGDYAYAERVWTNRLVQATGSAFNVVRWGQLAKPHQVPKGAWIALGFDGSRTTDATALIGTEILTGYQWKLGLWERPGNLKTWEVPVDEVNNLVAHAFDYWNVWRLYADPPYWESVIAEWMGIYNDSDEPGKARVVKWYTQGSSNRKLATAVLAYANAIVDGSLTHDGDPDFTRHIGNAQKRPLQLKDDKGQPMFTLQKERPDSLKKMDAAMAAVLSKQAQLDATALGIGAPPPKQSYRVEMVG